MQESRQEMQVLQVGIASICVRKASFELVEQQLIDDAAIEQYEPVVGQLRVGTA